MSETERDLTNGCGCIIRLRSIEGLFENGENGVQVRRITPCERPEHQDTQLYACAQEAMAEGGWMLHLLTKAFPDGEPIELTVGA